MTADDVNIVSINQSNSDIVVIFYLDSPNGGIVNAADIVQALQSENSKNAFKMLGLTLLQVSAVNPSTGTTNRPTSTVAPTKDSGLTDAEKVGIIVGSIGGIILIIIIICVIYFLYATCS